MAAGPNAAIVWLTAPAGFADNPAMTTSARDILHHYFGYDSFRAQQEAIVETVIQDNVVVGRQVLQELARALGEKQIQDVDVTKSIVEDTLSLVQPRLVSYEEQVCAAIRYSQYQYIQSRQRSTF